MFDRPPREKEWLSWTWVVLWSLVIFATIPFARALQTFASEHWGRRLFSDIVLVAIVLAAGAAALYVCRRHGGRFTTRHLWLAGTAAVFAWQTYELRHNPEESLHFIEYGVLGLLLFRAVSHRTRDPSIYLLAVLAGTLVGTLDEIVQWLTPRRFFGYRDIRLNAVAVVLVQLGIAAGLRPSFVRWPVPRGSLRRACRYALAVVVVLGACLLNTPARVEAYTRWMPFLAHVKEKSSLMTEYGHRHTDPEIGTFFSRLSLEELERVDTERAAEAAAMLDEYRDPRKYNDFLKTYTPLRNAFVHEARVHLWRRDHYRSVLWKHVADRSDYVRHCTIAWRENQVLERYYGRTLERSRYVLPPHEAGQLRAAADLRASFRSAVSADLITYFNERQAAVAIVLALVVLALAYRYLGERNGAQQPPPEERPGGTGVKGS